MHQPIFNKPKLKKKQKTPILNIYFQPNQKALALNTV